MRDSEMAVAIAAGDLAGFDAAYDRYAAAIYAYCRSLLPGPAAATAVRDTFVIATAKLAFLRDGDRVRPWLYAVARNECRRHGGAAPAGPDMAGDATRVPGSGRGPGAEPHEAVAAAIACLDPAQREVVELTLRHDLDDGDLAHMFGVSRGRAHALAAYARRQFEAWLGVLLVVTAGPQFCPDLGGLLAGKDADLRSELRNRVSRHINRCAVCAERRRRKLRPAMLLGLRPVAALPDGLWRDVRRLVTDAAPGGAANRARITQRAEPFGRSGFPVPLDPPRFARPPAHPVLTAVAGAAAVAVLTAGTVIVMGTPPRGGPQHDPGPALRVRTTRQTAPPLPSAIAGRRPATAPSAAPPVAAPISVTGTPGATTGQPGTSGPPAPSTAPGTLTVSASVVTLRRHGKDGRPAGWFTLTASGGPVSVFTVTVPDAYAGELTVTPATGSLASGRSVIVRVTLLGGGKAPLDAQLSVAPGSLIVTVSYRPPHD